jgi:hypothetical protein
MRRASDLMPSRVSAPRWRLLWSQALPIPRRFDRARISRPGSGWCRSRTRVGTKTSSAASANRRSLSAQFVHSRCARRDPLCEAPRHQTSAMARGIASAAANQGRRHRARQQDRSHGLGDDDERGALQGTRRTVGMKEIASGIGRDVNGWEGKQHVMQSRSIRRSGQPTRASALSNACC